MRIFQSLTAVTLHAHGIDAALDDGYRLRIRAMSESLLRIVVAPAAGLPIDRTWMVAPEGDVPWAGRARDDMAGFAPPPIDVSTGDAKTVLTAGNFRVTLTSAPFRISVEQRVGDMWQAWIQDRQTGGFASVERGTRLRHYQQRLETDRHFGLGDKTGPLDRTGRRFRLLQLDALGYDAEIGDPQYKHVPFIIVQSGLIVQSGGVATPALSSRGSSPGSIHPLAQAERVEGWIPPTRGGMTAGGEAPADAAIQTSVAGGLFYDTLAPMTFDVGQERSNYHGIYRYVEAEEPALDLWLIAGPDVAAVTKRFTLLTGRPALPPKWSFGFAFTTMHHADDANAQTIMSAFADRCRTEQIAISAIHFGSGYSSRGKRRYVFTWNTDKYPDPKALFEKLSGMGFPTVANLKPVLIDDHPDYAAVAAAGGFIKDENGAPVLEQFWDGMGSYLDFTNPETIRWWQERLRARVLDVGFTAGWNDNNEHEIGRDGATATGFGAPLDAIATRPLHALLMTRATFEATRDRTPDVRPFTITRAGPAGLQRYGETWTGDNATSWHTLKWNLRNGLSLALSGQSNVGHDIGGFTGPRPGPELLCRFVEMMALHPRAVMNSWKPHVAFGAAAATVPWLYPQVLPQIRNALNLRTTFLPLMYSLAQQSHRDGTPIIRPLFYDFPHDPRAYDDHDAMMLGPDVLFSPVVVEGATTKTQYLPTGPAGWIEYHTGELHAAGAIAVVTADLGRPPIFVRVGAALVLASTTPHIEPHEAPARKLYLALAGASGSDSGRHIEDDGVSWNEKSGAHLDLAINLTWSGDTANVTLTRCDGAWRIPDPSAWTTACPLVGVWKIEITHAV